MKRAMIMVAAVAAAVPLLGQQPGSGLHLQRTQTAFDLTVPLPYAQAAQLFGPEGERAWAGKHWNPRFLYPQTPHDEANVVFTVNHGPVTAVWVNTLFDLSEKHFIYAYFIPDIMVTTIDVRFSVADAKATQVHVIYTRTALTPEGNEHVQAFTARDNTAGHDWQQAIDDYVAKRPKR